MLCSQQEVIWSSILNIPNSRMKNLEDANSQTKERGDQIESNYTKLHELLLLGTW